MNINRAERVAFERKKKSSTERGIDFDLTLEQFADLRSAKECYYTGVELLGVLESIPATNRVSLERIDNNTGYTLSNTVAVSLEVNRLKNNLFESSENRSVKIKKLISKLDQLQYFGKRDTLGDIIKARLLLTLPFFGILA